MNEPLPSCISSEERVCVVVPSSQHCYFHLFLILFHFGPCQMELGGCSLPMEWRGIRELCS